MVYSLIDIYSHLPRQNYMKLTGYVETHKHNYNQHLNVQKLYPEIELQG